MKKLFLKDRFPISFIVSALIVLMMTLSILGSTAYAEEYIAGSHTWYTWDRHNNVTINVSYTPTTNSISIRLTKDYLGYSGGYRFSDGPEIIVSDQTLGNHTINVGTFTGLSPDTLYYFQLKVESICYWPNNGNNWGRGTDDDNFYSFPVYTNSMTPYNITFPTIGTNNIHVRWSNGNNPSNTSYTLQRSLDGINWVDVVTAQGMYEYTVTGLMQDTTYYFRVRVNEKSGRYNFSEVRCATTAADPAVSAAKAAQSAAEAANAAAQEAKAEAHNSRISADTARSYAEEAKNNTYYQGQSAAYWAYQAAQLANTPPIITKVQGQNGATCTKGASFTLVVTASDNGPPSNLRYRVTCDSYDSGWSSSNILTVTGLSVPGAKTATVMVSDNPNAPDSGNIAQIAFTFFKI